MPAAKAEAWARGTARPGVWMHATHARGLRTLYRDGFDLGAPEAFGRAWGDAVYLCRDRRTVAHYGAMIADVDARGWAAVEVVVRLDRVVALPVARFCDGASVLGVDHFARIAWHCGCFDSYARLLEMTRRRSRLCESEAAFYAIGWALQDAGVDAIEVDESAGPMPGWHADVQLVVFDPRRIVLIEDRIPRCAAA